MKITIYGWSTRAAFGWLRRYDTRRRHPYIGQRSPISYEDSLNPTSACPMFDADRHADSRAQAQLADRLANRA